MISIIIPTARGREHNLNRCVAAYASNTISEFEFVIVPDHLTWGAARGEGFRRSSGEYVHFTADDLEPAPGWDESAREEADASRVAAPVIYAPTWDCVESCGGYSHMDLPEGSAITNRSLVPFFSRAQWNALRVGSELDGLDRFSDHYLTHLARGQGFGIVVRYGYRFLHHWTKHETCGVARDRRAYEGLIRK